METATPDIPMDGPQRKGGRKKKTHVQRPPLSIMLSVWKALFLREALVRLFSQRAGWFWLLVEPVAQILFLMFLFAVVRVRVIGGISVSMWIMVGMLGFFTFKRAAMLSMRAVSMNQPLFAYRQVKPVDAVIVRGSVEGFLMLVVSLLLLAGGGLAGLEVMPTDPLGALAAFAALWLVGLGFGLVTSVITEIIAEAGEIISLVLTPLYFLSGVLFPVMTVPAPYRDVFLFNPILHGIESIRACFAVNYHTVPGIDLAYAYEFALVSIVFGLGLHRYFAMRLIAR